jgi:hypothetical protein
MMGLLRRYETQAELTAYDDGFCDGQASALEELQVARAMRSGYEGQPASDVKRLRDNLAAMSWWAAIGWSVALVSMTFVCK